MVMVVALAVVGLLLVRLADGVRVSVATAAPRAAVAPTPGSDRTITLVNRTDVTIWPAAWPGSVTGRTGWQLNPGAQVTFVVVGDWNARLWGRTGCHFDRGGRGGCQTGDCAGRFQCRGWGAIPSTLAEYDLDAYDHLDFYDVSMVDGSNLPMYITTVGGRTPDRISTNGCERRATAAPEWSIAQRRSRFTAAAGSSPASRRAHGSAATVIAVAVSSPPRATPPQPGRSTMHVCSSAPSPTPTPGPEITRPACSPARAAATTASPSA